MLSVIVIMFALYYSYQINFRRLENSERSFRAKKMDDLVILFNKLNIVLNYLNLYVNLTKLILK